MEICLLSCKEVCPTKEQHVFSQISAFCALIRVQILSTLIIGIKYVFEQCDANNSYWLVMRYAIYKLKSLLCLQDMHKNSFCVAWFCFVFCQTPFKILKLKKNIIFSTLLLNPGKRRHNSSLIQKIHDSFENILTLCISDNWILIFNFTTNYCLFATLKFNWVVHNMINNHTLWNCKSYNYVFFT